MPTDTAATSAGPQNLAFLEALYAEYQRDRNAVSASWRDYFDSLAEENGHTFRPGPSFQPRSIFNPPSKASEHAEAADGNGKAREVAEQLTQTANLQDRVDQMVRNFRVRGHLIADVDPLGLPKPEVRELDPDYYHFSQQDLDREFSTQTLGGTRGKASLRQIIERLHQTYCRSIGVEFMHIDDLDIRNWLQRQMEGSQNRIELSKSQQMRILTRLTDAVIFEQFLQKKFLGAKTFSLEGGESLIPLLDLTLESACEQGINDVVMAMAHRGRLNVLANIIGKRPSEIFKEFEDEDPKANLGGGDVKYHKGFSGVWEAASGEKAELTLCFNPSHLEFVNPVAMGKIRARQDRAGDASRENGMLILIHGDAAFAGEGIVQETLNMSQLPGYHVGGALNIIVNNQIGFTTGPREGRSSIYASSVAKMLQSPIFHVNGEDPEAVAQVIRIAMAFRAKYQRDVVIDMYCYRRRGHNEGDEPGYTQPLLYRHIINRKTVREGYLEHLQQHGGVTQSEADEIEQQSREKLESELEEARSHNFCLLPAPPTELWYHYRGGPVSNADEPETALPQEKLRWIIEQQLKLPDDFALHPKLQKQFKSKQDMASGQTPLDWATAESCAFGSLLLEGFPVRMTGQDSQRGTFSHRHAVLHHYREPRTLTPLGSLAPDQATIELHNSPLSEAGVMGFEYGYSLDCPDGLIIWEAQFGDFVNGGQVIIDQFITSGEDKWQRLSGLVLLLPHGFEGQGPEHSSARLERFLTQAAEDNIVVTQPSTAGQYYHLLRRQGRRKWRKPLIVLTPKRLLRHAASATPLHQLAEGRFQKVMSEVDDHVTPKRVRKILLCSGKVYFELIDHRQKNGIDDIAILRLEEFYPLPATDLRQSLAVYDESIPLVWVQEEPGNMGAWPFLVSRFYRDKVLGPRSFDVVSRPESASPATGSSASHKYEQQLLLNQALDLPTEE